MEVDELPFEEKAAAKKTGRKGDDTVLFCVHCRGVVQHGESSTAKVHVQSDRHKNNERREKKKKKKAAAPVGDTKEKRQQVLTPVMGLAAFVTTWALAVLVCGLTERQADIMSLPVRPLFGEDFPTGKTVLGRSTKFVKEIEGVLLKLVEGKPIPLGIDGSGMLINK